MQLAAMGDYEAPLTHGQQQMHVHDGTKGSTVGMHYSHQVMTASATTCAMLENITQFI